MSAIQTEAIHVQDPTQEATRIVGAIPVNQGMMIESPLGERFGIWRETTEVYILHFRGSEIKGSKHLATQALAKFMDLEGRRHAALQIVKDAIGQTYNPDGFAQAANGNRN